MGLKKLEEVEGQGLEAVNAWLASLEVIRHKALYQQVESLLGADLRYAERQAVQIDLEKIAERITLYTGWQKEHMKVVYNKRYKSSL